MGVVIGSRRCDAKPPRDRADSAGQRHGLLDVEAFRDERIAESERLCRRHLIEQLRRGLWSSGQHVETKLAELGGFLRGAVDTGS